MSTFTQGYALLIGVDAHSVARYALPDGGKDLEALAAVLTHPERCAYPADHVHRLQGETATRAAILEGLDWLQTQLEADETGNTTAVIYYSGHGWCNRAGAIPTYYLIPYDTQAQGDTPKAVTALRADEFADAIRALPANRLLVVLDCCHAAGLDVKELETFAPAALPVDLFLSESEADGTVSNPGGKGIEQLAIGRGRAVLNSCRSEQKSYIRSDRTMSIFTYHLIEALSGHAQPQQGAGEVLVSDILSYVHRHVPMSAQKQHAQLQDPDFTLSGNFAVALLLGGKGLTGGQPAPDPLDPLPAPPTTYQATNSGSGAIAQGTGAVAAGERGVAIGGNAGGNQIITGDGNRISRKTAFDQRGQTIHGDQINVDGDLNIRKGNG